MICLSCTKNTLLENLQLINKNKKFIDIVEIRSDFLDSSELSDLKEFPSLIDLPCILSFRLPKDGGVNNSISINDRNKILISALNNRWKYIDIEDDLDKETEKKIVDIAENHNVKIIKSFHDFSGVPQDLTNRMIINSKDGRYIPKAAIMPKNSKDLISIFKTHEKLYNAKKHFNFTLDYILVGMGNIGIPSRIMAGAWGSMLTYCSEGNIAAPGHISPKEMNDVFNYKNISKKTKIFGIIGKPVMHSKSPEIHNKKLKEAEIDGVYLPFETSNPEIIIKNAAFLNLHGLSVTSPNKEKIIKYLDYQDESVSCIKACNTMLRKDGWYGKNTDWIGFLKPIINIFDNAEKLKEKKAIVLGAGGAARAVVYALKKLNVEVLIANRTKEKAESLAKEFDCQFTSVDKLYNNKKKYDLLIQTTSLGMKPSADKTPLPEFDFKNIAIAYDLIYAPEKTKFLKEAELSGCTIINGFEMLKAQADEQFKLFIRRKSF